MRILVTGGAGFIGSNLVFQLVALDGDVLVVDDMSGGSIENLDPRAGFREADIRSEKFREIVREFKPEVIVHLAAQSSVAYGEEHPDETVDINVNGTRNVCEAALEIGAERVVFASSAAVYGDPERLPLTEDCAKEPINVYGRTKLEGEQVIDEMLRDSQVDFAILRFANVYGPRQGVTGEGGVVSAFSTALAAGETPCIEGDGKQTRDFIYVSDIVFALISCIGGEITFKGDPAEQVDAGRYNLGTGVAMSIEELGANFRMAAEFFGRYGTRPARPGDIRDSVLDSTRARNTFEFLPDTAPADGVGLTYRWFKARHDDDGPGDGGHDDDGPRVGGHDADGR